MKQQRRFLGKSFCSAAGEARRPTTNGYGPEGAGFMPPEDSAGPITDGLATDHTTGCEQELPESLSGHISRCQPCT